MYVRFENRTNSEIIEILTLFLMQYHAHEFEKAAERMKVIVTVDTYQCHLFAKTDLEQCTMKCFHFPLSHSGMA